MTYYEVDGWRADPSPERRREKRQVNEALLTFRVGKVDYPAVAESPSLLAFNGANKHVHDLLTPCTGRAGGGN